MTSFPRFPSAGQEIVLPPGSPAMAGATGAETAPPAEGELPSAFACVLELCTEPEMPAPPAPPAVMPGTSQPAADIPRRTASPESAQEGGESIRPGFNPPKHASAWWSGDVPAAGSGTMRASGGEDAAPPQAPELAPGVFAGPPLFPLTTTARSLRLEPPCVPLETAENDDAGSPVFHPVAEEADAPAEVPVEIMTLGMGLSLPVPLTAPQPENRVVGDQLQSNEEPVPMPPRTAITAPAAAPVSSDPETTSPIPADRFLQAAAKNQVENAPHAPLEKIAAPARPLVERSVASASRSAEYKFLNTDKQRDALPQKRHGTVNAKSPVDMQATPEPTPFQAAPTLSRAGAPAPGVEVVNATAPVVSPAVPLAATASEVTVRREISLPAADATAVVREVAELTHDFRFHERGSVEVKFNFKDDTELSVRLAYRDGDVQATFRTDSAELRATLGREWQGYAAQVAQESRGYRMADPVFTSSGDFSGSSQQGRDSGSATGGDARNQQQSSNPDQPGSQRSASPAHGFRPQSAAPSVSVSTPGPRVSTDRLLHAFA